MEVLISYGHGESDLEAVPVRALAEYVIAAEGGPFTTEVSISFVDDGAMAELNGRYRGMEGPTDVLSFECDSVADDLSDTLGAQEAVYELGDVVIAPDVARRQAAVYGQTFAEEIELLLVHGLLHLCGYDHLQDAEAEAMEAREEELLAAFRKEQGHGRS